MSFRSFGRRWQREQSFSPFSFSSTVLLLSDFGADDIGSFAPLGNFSLQVLLAPGGAEESFQSGFGRLNLVAVKADGDGVAPMLHPHQFTPRWWLASFTAASAMSEANEVSKEIILRSVWARHSVVRQMPSILSVPLALTPTRRMTISFSHSGHPTRMGFHMVPPRPGKRLRYSCRSYPAFSREWG